MLITPENVTVQDWEIRVDEDGAQRLGSHIPGANRAALLFFDLSSVIEHPVVIFQAELVFGITGPPGSAGEVSIGTILTPWLKGPLSWTTPWAGPGMVQDADYEPPRGVPFVTDDDGGLLKVKIDVTADLQRWMSARLRNLGWRVTSSSTFGAARNLIQAAQPTLSVKYSEGGVAACGAGLSTGAM